MCKVFGIVTTGICWLLGVVFALGALYGIFADDIEFGGIFVSTLLAVSFLCGGRVAGRKVRYGWEDLNKEDKAYLRGLERGRNK